MFYISHRDNINGQNKKEENNPEYIKIALEKVNDMWRLGTPEDLSYFR